VHALRSLEYFLYQYRRTWRGSAVSSVLTPVLFLASMGIGLGGYVHGGSGRIDGVRYAVYLAPGLLAATAMQTGVGESTWPVMAAIKWARTYHAMLATPLGVTDIVVGHLGFIALRLTLVSAVFIVVMGLFGVVHSVLGVVLAVPVAVLTGLAFAAPVAAFTATRESDSALSMLYRFGVVPLFLFSGTFFPVSQLPELVRPIAYVTPLWHGVTLSRDLALGRGSAPEMVLHALYLVVLLVVGVLAARVTYGRRLEQ
jgi:lipooligosaccharide transport system permease protein